MADTSEFVTGDDFISFDLGDAGDSPGPSRSSSPGALFDESLRPDRKGKGKAREDEPPSSAGASTPASSAGGKNNKKKRKGEPIGSAEKRVKTKKSPEPRPDDDLGSQTGPRNLKEERRARERGAPWAHDVDWRRLNRPSDMLNEEIHAFYQLMSPTEAEYQVRKTMIDYISVAIQRRWPAATVFAFGSWQTQLYLPTGDIDLVVTNPNFNEANKKRMLNELAGIVRSAGITHTVAIIGRARVPIIKFVTIDGHINVDISVNQTNGIMASKIIPRYLDALPGSRELILVVKAFLAQRSMNEVFTGGLGSYSVICLVISFLQMHPQLRNSAMDARRNLGTLLLEFFELYGRNFNYDAVGISLRRGGSYFLKRSRNWLHQQPFLLAIEDPQDPENDISKSSFGIRQVKMTLSGAYDLLQNCLYDREAQIHLRDGEKSPQDRSVELPSSPEDWSVLSSIMGLTKETFKFRDNMTKLHETQQVQKRLQIQLDLYSPRQDPPRLQSPPPHPSKDGKKAHAGSRWPRSERPDSPPPQHAADMEPGEIPPPPAQSHGYDPLGAINVDDDSAPEDQPSSASEDSSTSGGDSDSSEAEQSPSKKQKPTRDPRSVSEDSSLWSQSPPTSPVPPQTKPEEEDTRYAMSQKRKNKVKAKKERARNRKAKAIDAAEQKEAEAVAAKVGELDSKAAKNRAKRERKKERQKERAAQAKQEAAAGNGAAAKGNAQEAPAKGKGKVKTSATKPAARPASAGPSRATSPHAVPSTAASAPGSPRGERVKRSDRAAFWAAKGIIQEEDVHEDEE